MSFTITTTDEKDEKDEKDDQKSAPPSPDALERMTAIELKNVCKMHGIRGYSGLAKKKLRELISDHFSDIVITEEIISKKHLSTLKLPEIKKICNKLNLTTGKKSKNDLITKLLNHHKQQNHNIDPDTTPNNSPETTTQFVEAKYDYLSSDYDESDYLNSSSDDNVSMSFYDKCWESA